MKSRVVSLCVDKGEEEKKDKECMKTSAFKKWRMVKVLLKMARFIAPRLKAPFIHRGGWKELSTLLVTHQRSWKIRLGRWEDNLVS